MRPTSRATTSWSEPTMTMSPSTTPSTSPGLARPAARQTDPVGDRDGAVPGRRLRPTAWRARWTVGQASGLEHRHGGHVPGQRSGPARRAPRCPRRRRRGPRPLPRAPCLRRSDSTTTPAARSRAAARIASMRLAGRGSVARPEKMTTAPTLAKMDASPLPAAHATIPVAAGGPSDDRPASGSADAAVTGAVGPVPIATGVVVIVVGVGGQSVVGDEPGDADTVRAAGLDAGLDSRARVLHVGVDVPLAVATDDEDGVAQLDQARAQPGNAVLVLDSESRYITSYSGPVGSPSGTTSGVERAGSRARSPALGPEPAAPVGRGHPEDDPAVIARSERSRHSSTSTRPAPPASTTPARASTSSCSGVALQRHPGRPRGAAATTAYRPHRARRPSAAASSGGRLARPPRASCPPSDRSPLARPRCRRGQPGGEQRRRSTVGAGARLGEPADELAEDDARSCPGRSRAVAWRRLEQVRDTVQPLAASSRQHSLDGRRRR